MNAFRCAVRTGEAPGTGGVETNRDAHGRGRRCSIGHNAKNPGVQVRIREQSAVAELVIPPDTPKYKRTPDVCMSLLTQQGVPETPERREAVEELLRTYSHARGCNGVVARATPPTHGADGWIEWFVGEDDAAQLGESLAEVEELDDEASCDFYNQQHFCMIREDQRIARVHPPTKGTDGVDVRGRPLPAKAGVPARLRNDASIHRTAQGELIAQCDGVLSVSGNRVSIAQFLEIPGYVDFSTGNIDFEGDLYIHEGVRDRFDVRCSGNMVVRGLIEAAHLECDGDFTALKGFAGRREGALIVSGDAAGRYFDAVTIDIGRTFRPAREVVQCNTVVRGDVEAPVARIMGGTLTCIGKVSIGTLGSPSGAPTTLVLATLPGVGETSSSISTVISMLEKMLARQRKELNMLLERGERLGASQLERREELLCEVEANEQRLARANDHKARLERTISLVRTVDLRIGRFLHAGSILRIDGRDYRIMEDVRGPIHIRESRGGEVLVTDPVSKAAFPLQSIAEIKAVA